MTTIDLPYPPSVNSIWRQNRKTGKTYLDPKYRAWKAEVDGAFLQNKRIWKPVPGRFRASFTLNESQPHRGDLDNRIKAVLDVLQRLGLIENDRLCVKFDVEWGLVNGCRVTLEAA